MSMGLTVNQLIEALELHRDFGGRGDTEVWMEADGDYGVYERAVRDVFVDSDDVDVTISSRVRGS